jgi:hypothetical protein
MGGAILPLARASSWSAQGKIYLKLTLRFRVILTGELRVLVSIIGH